MTDKPTPKEIEDLFVEETGFDTDDFPAAIFDFARAVLAKWGQPAQAAEPVAVVVPCYTPSGKRVALCSAKQDLPIGTQLYTAPQPSPAAQGDAIEHELAMLIRRIVSSARRNCQDESNVLKLANEAWAYLVRKGLVGSPLRDAGIESDVAPQAADSVQEDAADPLQGAANWLAEAHGQFSPVVLSGCLMIGYNRAKRLHDAALAARKQGGL